jgi:AhpD family alkylhydroperoxidase
MQPGADPATAAEAARADIRATLGFVPRFLSEVPERALPGAWDEMKSVQMNPNTALPPRVKELIGLAVAAQVPCDYCTYAHTQFARMDGAGEEQVKEAVIIGSLTRHWSTMTQGFQLDLAAHRREVQSAIEHMRRVRSGQAAPPQPMEVTDAASALRDIQQYFGSVPEFMRRFPPEGLAGAWRQMRDVMMNPNTAIEPKYKSLISLAVGSQIPCRFCLAADTQFAKELDGATEREIAEAIAMAAATRYWSTWLNGAQLDEPGFRRDVDRIVRGARQQAAASKPGVSAKAGDRQPVKGTDAAAKPANRPAAGAKPAASQ